MSAPRRVRHRAAVKYLVLYLRPRGISSESDCFVATSDHAIRRQIRARWDDFLERDLPVICATIRHEILGRSWGAL